MMITRTIVALTGAVALALGLLTLGSAEAKPTPPYTPAFEVVTHTEGVPNPGPGNTEATVTVTCPTGKRVTGGGFDYADPQHQAVVINGSHPNTAGSAWLVDVVSSANDPELNPQITAHAICANPS